MTYIAYQLCWIALNLDMFLLSPRTYQFHWMFLNPITPLLNIFVHQSGWICLNQCQPALGLYWISESISLAWAIIWLQPLSSVLSEFIQINGWNFLNFSLPFLNFIVNQSDWIYLNQCQPALELYWISQSISLASVIIWLQPLSSVLSKLFWNNGWIFLNCS